MNRFAVLGDIHFTDEGPHRQAIEQGAWARADLLRYAAARRHYYGVLAEEVRAPRPDFVMQLGDLVTAQWDAPHQAVDEMRAALAWLTSAGCPVYPLRGNHDDSGLAEASAVVLAPYLDRMPITSRTGFSYEFSAGGARFVFVDCREAYSVPETRSWLLGLWHRLAHGGRLFLFAREPLFAVARPCFSTPEFVRVLHEAVRDWQLDAYFCGHTHNQAWTYHPEFGAGGAIQIKTCVAGEIGKEPLPLDQTRSLLIAPRIAIWAAAWRIRCRPGFWWRRMPSA